MKGKEEIFRASNSKNLSEEIEKIFNYFRKNGFPHYNLKDYDTERELKNLINFNENSICNGDLLNKTNHGLGLLWCYFPHWVDIHYKNYPNSLIDNWNEDSKLKDLINRTYKWHLKNSNCKSIYQRIRQNSKIYCSKQSVSNFHPSVAKFIYNKFGNKGIVWDMSAGWGGRLFGFLASNCKKYIGTEPSSKSFKGLKKLKETYSSIDKQIELHCIGSEHFKPKPNSIDLCFTSPPYFDTEQYSHEKTQSFKAYPTKDIWLKEYLRKTIKNCKTALKREGFLILNISNTSHYHWLENETLRITTSEGFELVGEYHMVLSSIAGKGIKTEPIFVFMKTS